MPKNAEKFSCEKCGFICSKKSNFDKHLLTRKHKMLTNGNEKMPENAAPNYECECGKKYKQHSGLSRHKKNCNYEEKKENEENKDLNYKEMFMHMMNKNNELQQTIKDMIPKIGNTSYTQNNNFNLQLFLNEDCKDALNIITCL